MAGTAMDRSATIMAWAGARREFWGCRSLATLTLVAAEFAAGYAGHSISLVSDGIHNLTDVPTLVISWLATRWALRPPTPEKTYGYHRAGILAAFVNAMLLAFAALFLIYESVGRLRHPVEVGTEPDDVGLVAGAGDQRRHHPRGVIAGGAI